MTREKLNAAIAEAKRFIALAEAAKDDMSALAGTDRFICGTRASGACRRASMDLTRTLADLRSPFR